MAPKGRGAQWEAVARKASVDLDPRWTLVGRGARTVLTWGRIGWVWQSVGVDLKSGDRHELFASRAWLTMPFSRSITAVDSDLLAPSPERDVVLDDGAADQVRRWAALVPDRVFNRTLEQDLARLEWHFDLFLTEGENFPWMPLAGLRLVFGQDPTPVVDAADEWLQGPAGSTRRGGEDPELLFWREFRLRLEDEREATLRWLDDQRRAALGAERVPDDLVEPVLGDVHPR